MRRASVDRLKGDPFDVIIIGGGITGAATARDAALRGLSVLLVEKDDFAAGTSSRSSKLIHGGLRYLQTYQFRLVAESLSERERMLRLAPHLTEVRPFLYLLYKGYPETRRLLNLGLTFYDVASGAWRRRRHRMLDAAQVLAREPHLAADGLLGGGLYHDVLTDDARLTLDTAKGAAEAGALMLNHATVTGLVIEGGRCHGVQVDDRISGESVEVRARQVLNATGPWSDATRGFESPSEEPRLRPTKGVHIVVRKADFPLNTAIFLRSPDDRRVVWPTPSLESDRVYIGTTDTDYSGSPDDVHPDERDVRYLLNAANAAIPTARLTERHVVGSWAGLRPLVAPPTGVSAGNTSREHSITTGPTGMISIAGGKLTSSRLMAKQLVDAAVDVLGRPVPRSSRSAARVPISGGDRRAAIAVREAAAAVQVPSELVDLWLRRYGANARLLLDLWEDDPLNRDVIGPRGLTRAELRHAVREEMVQSLADLMIRRTALFFWDETGGLGEIDHLARELGHLLDWSPERTREEVAAYRSLVAQHRPADTD